MANLSGNFGVFDGIFFKEDFCLLERVPDMSLFPQWPESMFCHLDSAIKKILLYDSPFLVPYHVKFTQQHLLRIFLILQKVI